MSEFTEFEKGKFSQAEIKEIWTGRIAWYLIGGFLILIGVSFVPMLDVTTSLAIRVSSTADLIKTITSTFGGLVGAVIGYYFRAITKS